MTRSRTTAKDYRSQHQASYLGSDSDRVMARADAVVAIGCMALSILFGFNHLGTWAVPVYLGAALVFGGLALLVWRGSVPARWISGALFLFVAAVTVDFVAGLRQTCYPPPQHWLTSLFTVLVLGTAWVSGIAVYTSRANHTWLGSFMMALTAMLVVLIVGFVLTMVGMFSPIGWCATGPGL